MSASTTETPVADFLEQMLRDSFKEHPHPARIDNPILRRRQFPYDALDYCLTDLLRRDFAPGYARFDTKIQSRDPVEQYVAALGYLLGYALDPAANAVGRLHLLFDAGTIALQPLIFALDRLFCNFCSKWVWSEDRTIHPKAETVMQSQGSSLGFILSSGLDDCDDATRFATIQMLQCNNWLAKLLREQISDAIRYGRLPCFEFERFVHLDRMFHGLPVCVEGPSPYDDVDGWNSRQDALAKLRSELRAGKPRSVMTEALADRITFVGDFQIRRERLLWEALCEAMRPHREWFLEQLQIPNSLVKRASVLALLGIDPQGGGAALFAIASVDELVASLLLRSINQLRLWIPTGPEPFRTLVLKVLSRALTSTQSRFDAVLVAKKLSLPPVELADVLVDLVEAADECPHDVAEVLGPVICAADDPTLWSNVGRLVGSECGRTVTLALTAVQERAPWVTRYLGLPIDEAPGNGNWIASYVSCQPYYKDVNGQTAWERLRMQAVTDVEYFQKPSEADGRNYCERRFGTKRGDYFYTSDYDAQQLAQAVACDPRFAQEFLRAVVANSRRDLDVAWSLVGLAGLRHVAGADRTLCGALNDAGRHDSPIVSAAVHYLSERASRVFSTSMLPGAPAKLEMPEHFNKVARFADRDTVEKVVLAMKKADRPSTWSDDDDSFQDAMCHLLTHPQSVARIEAEFPEFPEVLSKRVLVYLGGIVRNVAIDVNRRRKQREFELGVRSGESSVDDVAAKSQRSLPDADQLRREMTLQKIPRMRERVLFLCRDHRIPRSELPALLNITWLQLKATEKQLKRYLKK